MFLGFEKTGNRREDDSFFLEAISSYLLNESEAGKEEAFIANCANISALIYSYLDKINWAGFYFLRKNKLVLGPFQGEPACSIIQIGKGVCGTSVKEKRAIIVADVDKFPGHIACSSKSKSELVVPILKSKGEIIGVIDIDSPILNRFAEEDLSLIEKVARIVSDIYSNQKRE